MTKLINLPNHMKSLKPFFIMSRSMMLFLPARAWVTVPCLLSLLLPYRADAAPVQGARVSDMSGNTNILLKQPQRTSQNLQRGQTIDNRDLIEVPARSRSWAQLIAIGPSLQAKLIGLANKTTWRLPCTFSGSGFISWSGGGNSGCSPPVVVIKGSSKSNYSNNSSLLNQAPLIASSEPDIKLPIAQVSQLFAACSATDEAGNNAKTAVTLLGIDPCGKAVQDCERAGGSVSACVVVSEGEWRQGSVAFAQCDYQLEKLTTWVAVLAFLNTLLGQSSNCVLHVLSPGDALLVPENGQRTAIAFENNGKGAVISVIEGAARIVSRRSDEWELLSSGETYIASSGQRRSTRDWLLRSEICENLLGFNTQPVSQYLVASATDLAQTFTHPSVNFDDLQNTYCRR